jgi:hypothetical protein
MRMRNELPAAVRDAAVAFRSIAEPAYKQT